MRRHHDTVSLETSLEFHARKSKLFNTLRPRQNGRHFPDDIFQWIFLNKNAWISINTSLKYVPQGPINNIPALVQIMAWRRPGGKPLSEPMMVRLPTHICVTQPQWVNRAVVHYLSSIFIYMSSMRDSVYENHEKYKHKKIPTRISGFPWLKVGGWNYRLSSM